MNTNDINNPLTTEDINILRHNYITCDAHLVASHRIISHLESENRHLRELIGMLIKSSSISKLE